MNDHPPFPERQPLAVPDAAADDRISTLELINVVLRRRRLILGAGIGLMLLLAARAVLAYGDERYTASATFATTQPTSSTSDLSSFARQLGVGSSSRSGPSPDFFASLASSTPLLRVVVARPYVATLDEDTVSGTLVQLYGIESAKPEAARRRAAARLAKSVKAEVSKPTGFVTVQATTMAPDLSEQVVANIIEAVRQYNRDAQRVQASAEADFIAERLQDAQGNLDAAETALAAFMRRNRAFASSPDLLLEHDNLQRRVQVQQEFVLSLARSLEQSRMEQLHDLPQVRILEPPAGSAVRDRPVPLVPMAVLGLVLGLVLGVLVAFLLELFRRGRHQGGSEYAEYQALRRDTLADLSLPIRWVRRRQVS